MVVRVQTIIGNYEFVSYFGLAIYPSYASFVSCIVNAIQVFYIAFCVRLIAFGNNATRKRVLIVLPEQNKSNICDNYYND